MTVNYIGSIDNRHEVSEYVLSTGTKLVLSKEEVDEFVFDIRMLGILEDCEDDEEYDDDLSSLICSFRMYRSE